MIWLSFALAWLVFITSNLYKPLQHSRANNPLSILRQIGLKSGIARC
jgi:hypothetical protein